MQSQDCTNFSELIRARSKRNYGIILILLTLTLLLPTTLVAAETIGQPFTRRYSLDEIGVSSGSFLGFDQIGRVAVISGGKYTVLNDSTWISLIERDKQNHTILSTANDELGNTYFGTLAGWGLLKHDAHGKLTVQLLNPKDVPPWVYTTNFDFVVPHKNGVYFAGLNGIVHWDRSSKKHTFIEARDVARIFTLGSKLYVSSYSLGIQYIDTDGQTLVQANLNEDRIFVIDQVATLSDNEAIITTRGKRIALFDGTKVHPWSNALGTLQTNYVSNLIKLPNNDIAVAIDQQGLYILGENGECKLALTNSNYHRIRHLASSEPGVLWIASENEVRKILYNDPVSIIDQRSGLPVIWPLVTELQGQTFVASHSELFESVLSADGLSQRFQRVVDQPLFGAQCVTSLADQLLVGNGKGVFVKEGANFRQLISGFEVNQLVAVDNNVCFAIGSTTIAALQWNGTSWGEFADRIEGVGFPYVSVGAKDSAWIELGINLVARVSLNQGIIEATVYKEFPWGTSSWVNVGVLDNTVILSNQESERLYFDEQNGSFIDAPELSQLFLEAPTPITRVIQSKDKKIWASHEYGIYEISRKNSKYVYHVDSYKSLQERFPAIQVTSSGNIWVSTGSSLYRIESEKPYERSRPQNPFLVSITDTKNQNQIYSIFHSKSIPDKLPYENNNIELLFFSGGYASSKSPQYEFEMSSNSNAWKIETQNSSISMSNLKEGSYELSTRLLEANFTQSKEVVTQFFIAPPWFRSPIAYTSYSISALAILLGSVAMATRRSKQRQTYLEELVQQRTRKLQSTKEALIEKERKAAILSERDRMASEIHDSVQQGLSGIALQLDATLKLPDLADSVHSRLKVARSMVSFTRQELQQTVWDLESPLLENENLGDALEKIAQFINSSSTQIIINTSKFTNCFDSSVKHNLLRIAQEAIANSIRHGKAKRIDITLTSTASSLKLSITDDGEGFNPNQISNDRLGHFGIRGMRSRAAKLNGTIEITSHPEAGTQIRVTVPVESTLSQ